MLSNAVLQRLWPRCPAAIRDGIIEKAPAVFPKYGIDTPLLVAHFMAQISHECGAGTEIVENLNYSPEGIVRTWPTRFASMAAALPFAHHPQLLADKVYNGRMGNRAGSDDGWLFRGRGGTNTTGHDGYYKLAMKMALDLLSNPDKVNDPDLFLECAVVDYILCGCLPFAKNDDIRGETHHLNGGYIGLTERERWLAKWKVSLAAEHGEASVTIQKPDDGFLRFGDRGYKVAAVQRRLDELGYHVGAVDESFDEATRTAVLSFQSHEGLPTTGVVDKATEAALQVAQPRPISEGRATATVDDLKEAGSGTVSSADMIKKAGQVAVGTAAVGGTADQTGVLDHVKDGVDQVSGLRSVIESVQDLGHWATQYWWIAVIVGGAVIWYFGHDVIKRRLEDHRSGANMGR